MLIALIVAVVLIIAVSALALCKAAGDADRQYEEMYIRYMKEKAHEAAQHAAGSAPAIHEG